MSGRRLYSLTGSYLKTSEHGVSHLVPSAVDFRLAIRMLAKYPVLSGVSVIGMAVAIAIGASVFGFVAAVLDPTMPIEGGDRIVAV